MENFNINWFGVLLAAISSFIIGGVWYSALFAKKWQQLVGLKDEELRKGMGKVFAGSFILSLIMATNLGFFIGNETALFGLFAGLAVGLGWIAAAFGINYLFERRSFMLLAINAGYNIVAASIMGLIIGAF